MACRNLPISPAIDLAYVGANGANGTNAAIKPQYA